MRQVQGAALVALVLAAVGGLLLAWEGPSMPYWSPAPTGLPPLAVAAGAGVVFLLAVILVVAFSQRERRRRQAPAAVDGVQVDVAETADADRIIDVRVLHAQIRTLEQALERESGLARESAITPEMTKDAVEEFHLRVQSTVRGLAVRMKSDPAAVHVLARVEAAVTRLMAPAAPFVRPTLTVSGQTTTLPTEVVTPAAPDLEGTHSGPVLAAPLDEEAVLPIPARMPSPEIRRGRRWLRRSAA